MTDNPTKVYNDYIRANLPIGMEYNTGVDRYQVNNHSFFKYKNSNWYYKYVSKFGYSAASVYFVNGFEPALVLDFTEDYFRTAGTETTFDSAITHAATTNATMVDSDGLLKWRPHNLMTYSEDFSNSSFNKDRVTVTAGQVDPRGGADGWKVTTTTDSGTHALVKQVAHSNLPAAAINSYTVSVFAKADGYNFLGIGVEGNTKATFNLSNGSIDTVAAPTTASITSVGNGWYLCSIETNGAGAKQEIFAVNNVSGTGSYGQLSYAGDGTSGIILAYPHTYRSDLGGMVNNPDRGDSYVPTTTAARYLPRRGHHVYNGTSWVNEGLLHESDARTNLVTYSEDFTDASWANFRSTVTAGSAASPSGAIDATTLTDDTSTGSHEVVFSPAGTTNRALTASVFVKAGTFSFAQILLNANGVSTASAQAVINLTDGSILSETYGADTTGGSAHVEDYGSGWYRFSVAATVLNTLGTGSLQHRILLHNGSTNSYSGTGTGTILIYGAQFEAGSTPSSYIPTAGATATRAAETLTVPAANMPWPTPVVIGPELVTNGTFDTDTTGWTASNSTLGVVSNALSVTRDAASAYARQDVTIEVGKVYEVSATRLSTSPFAGASTMRIGTSAGGTQYGAIVFGTGTDDTELSAVFVATTTTASLTVGWGMSTNGDIVYHDNVSVKEINPLSVSIQMDGLATWAGGRNSNPNTELFEWRVNSSNYINDQFDSNASLQIWQFLQVSSGTVDLVGSNIANLGGVNQPFNISSRHGSTFLNAAVDGTALTANTTPTALPDLSARDFWLAPTYMGTIGKLRVWSDDIGDTGIAEAST